MPRCANCGTRNVKYVWNSKTFRTDLNNQNLCNDCYCELQTQEIANSPNTIKNTKPLKKCNWCHFSSKTSVKIEKQNVHNIFAELAGADESLQYDYEDKYSCSKFGFELSSMSKAENCTSYITPYDYE